MSDVELLPNSMSFRVISTLDVDDENEIPPDFTGRVRRSFNGAESYVAWFTDGRLDNPGRSHPAYRRYRSDGQVKYEMFYERGQLQDPSDREPAVRGYFANGRLHYEEHYRDGRRCDAVNGSPAVSKWRSDGTLRHQLRYRKGKRVTGRHSPVS
jgi:hypothetical protein